MGDPRRKTRVLVFPCGSENASEIHEALRYSLHVELFGASSVDDHGRFRFKNYTGDVPRITEPGFTTIFGDLVEKLAIDLVFATHDSVQEYLAPIAQELGFFLINGNPETASILRRKSATYDCFRKEAWVPATFRSPNEVRKWPVVVKPDLGQGGQFVSIVENAGALAEALALTAEPVIVEYLSGDEATVDCFTDSNRELLWVGPRTRERVRAGISMRSRFLEPDPEILFIAASINERLVLRGPWFFQVKRSTLGVWKLLEISCRIAGTMVAQRARGVNLPLMAVQDYLGRSLIALPQPAVRLIERAIETRAELEAEFDTVFVDLDDTLIIDGAVTPVVVQFLYQMRNTGREIVLITRHGLDCATTLVEAGLSLTMFERVIHITDGSPKSNYVTDRSIFIDNHFPERLEVYSKLGIPVLDVDMLGLFVR